MKTKTTFLYRQTCLVLFLLFSSITGFGQNTYTHNFTSTVWNSNGNRIISGVEWNLTTTTGNGFYSYDAAKGQQLGSSGSPFLSATLKTTEIIGLVTSIKISSSIASSGTAKIASVSVGGVEFTPTNQSLTTNNQQYTFQGNGSGEIIIKWTNTQRAFYVKKIEIEYNENPTQTFTPEINFSGESLGGNATFLGAANVTLSTTTADAAIYYTTDGSEPTTSSFLYNAPFDVSATTTVKAFAVAADLDDSAIAEKTVTVVAPPTFTIPYTAVFNNGWRSYVNNAAANQIHWVLSAADARVNGHNTNNKEIWLLSSEITSPQAISTLLLSFQHTSQYLNGKPLDVKYSSDYTGYGDPALADWTTATTITPSSSGALLNQAIPTTGTVYIALVYKDISSPYVQWTISNLYLTAPPQLNVTPESLPALNYTENNGPSASQSFSISGSYLTHDVVLTASQNFELTESAAADALYTPSVTLNDYDGTEKYIYARLKSGLTVNTYAGNVTVTSEGAAQKTVILNGEVTQPVPVVTEQTFNAEVNTSFSAALTANNPPQSFTIISGSLPPGLSLNENTGTISGTPTAAGTYNFSVTATNSGGTSTPAGISIIVAKTIQSVQLPNLSKLTSDVPFDLPEVTTQNVGLTYSIVPGNIASINGTTVTILQAGTATITAENNGNENHLPFSQSFTLTVTQTIEKPIVASETISGTFNTTITPYTINATGNPTHYALADGSTLPAGLDLNTVTGEISGIPTAAGTFTVQVTATNSAGTSDAATLTFNIAKTDQHQAFASIVKTTTDTPFELPLATTENILLQYSSNATGVATVNGNTVTITGEGITTITATNSGDGNHNPFTASFVLTVKEVPVITPATLTKNAGTAVSYTITATTSNPVFSIASGSVLPSGLVLDANTGTISGIPTQAGYFTTAIIATANDVSSAPATFTFIIVEPATAGGMCFTEDFSSITNGNNSTTSGSSTNWPGNVNFLNTVNAFQAGGVVRLGSANQAGSVLSKVLDNLSGNLTVTFDVKGWTNIEGNIKVTLGTVSETVLYTAKMNQSFETRTITFENVPANSKLKIETTARRAFIDNVSVCKTGIWKNVCIDSTLAQLSATFPGEDSITWYTSPTSAVALNDAFVLIDGIYYKEVNGIREAVEVTTYPVPATLAPNPRMVVCGSQALENIEVNGLSGAVIKWYTDETSADTLSLTTSIADNTTYFVSQTLNGCESERSAFTFKVYNLQAPAAAAQTFCENANATIAQLTASGAIENASYKWYSTATSNTPLAETVLVANGTYYVSQTIEGCESNRTPVVITIIDSEGPVLTEQLFCGSATVADLPQNNGIYKWYNSAGATLPLNGNINLSTNTYYVTQTTEGCESDKKAVSVTILPVPEAPAVTAQMFCGSAAIASLPQNNGLYKWYTSATEGAVLAPDTALANGMTYYVAQTVNGCESVNRTPVTVTINPVPDAPAVMGQTFCGNATISDLPQNSGSYKWYASLAGTSVLTPETALSSGNYYVSQTVNGCESARSAVTVTLHPVPDAPNVASQVFCESAAAADLPQNNGLYKWYISSSDGPVLTPDISLINGTTYYVSQTLNGCESVNRTPVTVTIHPLPEAPAVTAQMFCGSAAIADLPQNNGLYKWYTSATEGAVLAPDTALANGMTYYVAQTVNGCESVNRTPVTVTINPVPDAPAVMGQTFCGNATIADLPQNSGSYKWYASLAGTSVLTPETALSSGNYYVSQTVNGCESARSAVTVTLYPVPDAPNIASQVFCGSAAVADLPQNNGTYRWYSSVTDDTVLANGTALTNGVTYYAAQTLNGCESVNRTPVTVTIHPVPEAPAVTAQTFCGSAAIADLPQHNGTYKWYTSATGGAALPSGTALANGMVYYVSLTLNGCESVNRTPVTVTINTIPGIPDIPVQTFCGSATIADLPQGTASSYRWYSQASGGNVLTPAIQLTHNVTYYASQVVNGCESARKAVRVIINTVPDAPAMSSKIFCNSASVADLSPNNSNYKWYAQAGDGLPLASTVSLSSTTYYVSQVVNGCESARTAVQVSINPVPYALPQTVYTVCGNQTLAETQVGAQAGAAVKWYQSATAVQPLSDQMFLSNNATYYVTQVVNGCESERVPLTFMIIQLQKPNSSSQVFCGAATVNDLTAEGHENAVFKWYTSSTSSVALAPAAALTNGTYYVSQAVGECESERKAINVAILHVTAPNLSPYTLCDGATVADIAMPSESAVSYNWYSTPDAMLPLPEHTELSSGTYFVSKVQSGCESVKTPVHITVLPKPDTPTGNTLQAFEITVPSDATIANLQVNEMDIVWYITLEDAQTDTNPLLASMPLVNGTVYYGVRRNENGCVSNALEVTVTVTLDTKTFDFSSFVYHPNPVTDILHVSYKTVINRATVYNLIGQVLRDTHFSDKQIKMDMSGLSSGTYIIRFYSDNQSHFIKVIKK